MLLYHRITEKHPKKIIILHGLFGSSDNWQTIARELGSKNFSVAVLDLRNHGRSPHDVEFNYDVMADDVAETIRFMHFEGSILIGHSLGGKTAMNLAFRYPSLISGLIVVDIAPGAYHQRHQFILQALNSINFKEVHSRNCVEEKLKETITDESVRQWLMKSLYRIEDNRFSWRFNLESITKNIEEVGRATIPEKLCIIPALFLRGEFSDYIQEKDENEIRTYFKNSYVVTIPGSGHWLHAEKPELFLEQVLNFAGNLIR